MSTTNRRVAVVTGAARGIGAGIAAVLVGRGLAVVAVDVDSQKEGISSTATGLVLPVAADVSTPAGATAAIEAALGEFGRIDILVNNAGTNVFKPFLEHTYQDWRRVMTVNLDSVFLLCQAAIPHMVERRWGAIVTPMRRDSSLAQHLSARVASIFGSQDHHMAPNNSARGPSARISLVYGRCASHRPPERGQAVGA